MTYLPSKVIQGVGAKTGHKEAIRNITRAKLLGLCKENQNSPAAEAWKGIKSSHSPPTLVGKAGPLPFAQWSG